MEIDTVLPSRFGSLPPVPMGCGAEHAFSVNNARQKIPAGLLGVIAFRPRRVVGIFWPSPPIRIFTRFAERVPRPNGPRKLI